MKAKLKALFTDSMWSIAGLMLMNIVAQFAVYPAWNRVLGSEVYGNVLYLMSLLNIVAISMGSGANYARMTVAGKENVSNKPYLLMLGIFTALAFPFAWIVRAMGFVSMSGMECFLYAMLTVVTMWRFYADVEYRLNLDFRGYFVYYVFISIGYGIGIILLWYTGMWPLALLPGEIFGIALVALKGKALKWDALLEKSALWESCRVILILFGTNVISNVVFNGDRLLLKTMMGGTAVTAYYLASLLGKTMSLVTTPLNSVIVGHLAKYSGKLTVKQAHGLSLGCVIVAIAATAVCTLASHILIPLLYPQDYKIANNYFIIANLAQVLYFIGNVVTVILLRFADTKYQIHVNVVYAVAFCAMCIPLTRKAGLPGFCAGLLLTCVIRLGYSLGLCYYNAGKKK